MVWRRPLLPWLDTDGDEELQRVLQVAADEATGTKGEIPIPITRGQVLLLGEGPQARIFVVDGFITLDSPLMLAGMFCSIEADRLQSTEWKARKKAYHEEMARWQKHMQPGQAKRTRASERIQRKGVGVEPAWDPFLGMRISLASQASRLWEGCVRPDKLPFEQLASQLQGLVIRTPDTKAIKPGGLRLAGVNRTIRFDLSPPTRPSLKNLSTPK
jgi:hypothetical protein